jgi:hypothetical protein
MIMAAAVLLALQLWVIVTPLNISSDNALLAKHSITQHHGASTNTATAGCGDMDLAAGWQHNGGVTAAVPTAAAEAAGSPAAAAEAVSLLHQQQQQQQPGESLNWSVPGVREWLMGSSAAAGVRQIPDGAVSMNIAQGGG